MSDKLQLVNRYRTASGSDRPLVELTYEKKERAGRYRSRFCNDQWQTTRRKLIGQDIDRWSNVIQTIHPVKRSPSMRHQLQFLRVVFVAIALFLGLTGIAVAQEITGSIVGTVKDPNGAAVAGATVTVTDSEKKIVVRTVQTNSDGEYTVRDLPVTIYDVAVEAPNFKK